MTSNPSPKRHALRMSRLLAACVLCLAAALMALAGCTQEKHSEAKADGLVLDLWHAYRDAEKDALEAVVRDFMAANPSIKVKPLAVPDESYANKVFTAIPRGSGPDVFISAHDPIGNWADNKIIADLTPYVTEDELKDFHPVTVDALRYTLKASKDQAEVKGIWAIPLAYKSAVLFYNKDKVPTPPATTSEMLKILEKSTVQSCAPNDAGCKQHYGLVYENTNLFFHSVWLNGFGGSLFDDEGNIRPDNEGNAKSFEFAKKVNQFLPSGVDGARIKSLFSDGTADMVINGPWFMAELDRSKLNYGVAVLPRIDEPGAPENAWAMPYVTAEGIYLARSTRASIALEGMKESDAGYAQAKAAVEARRAAAVNLM